MKMLFLNLSIGSASSNNSVYHSLKILSITFRALKVTLICSHSKSDEAETFEIMTRFISFKSAKLQVIVEYARDSIENEAFS